MKKILIACSALMLIVGLGSCGPKKSAYRKAYEQAKQREIATQDTGRTVTYEEPASKVATPVQPIVVRKEKVAPVEGENRSNLKRYSVVVGSFQNPTNARALKDKMVSHGYNAVLAKNDYGMMRVIISSFDTREEAAASRDAVKARFSPEFKDAWLLENI